MSTRFKIRRDRLFKKDPHCYWCGKEVFNQPISEWLKNGTKMPHNFATLDHLHDKWEPEKRRNGMKTNISQTVLACHQCNRRRNKERQKEIPKWAVRVRAALGEERKRLNDITPRPQVFKGLSTNNDLLK